MKRRGMGIMYLCVWVGGLKNDDARANYCLRSWTTSCFFPRNLHFRPCVLVQRGTFVKWRLCNIDLGS